MAKNQLVKNKKTGQYGVYNPFNDTVTYITSDMSLVKNTRGKYGFKSGNEIIELGEIPKTINLEETFKKKVDTVSSSATSSTDSTSDFFKPVGVEAVDTKEPKKRIEAKQAAKQEESQRYIDIFGLTRLDYSGLQNFGSLGEVVADVLDVPANLSKAFVRGVSNGRINQAIMDYAKDGETMDSDLIARLIKENKTKTGSTYLKTLQEKGVLQTEDLSAAGGIAETIMESMGSMLGAVKAGFQGAVVGGSTGLATGAAATSIGGPVGAALGAVGGATGGAVSGFAGFTSYANEYGSTIVQALTEKGYDLTDKNSVEKGLKDKSVMDAAKEKANTRGLTVGAFDAITAGLAGKGAKLAVNIARGSAAKVGKELTKAGVKRIAGATALGIESTMGSVGEAMGQLATEGKITDYDAVALEGIAEIGNAGPSTAFAMYKSGQINSDLNQENQAKIESLKKAKEAIPADNEASLNAIDNKISALEKENKNRNKAMTSALQVAPVPATKRVIELTDSILELEATLEAIKDGSRTDVSQEAKKAMWDSLNDMIAERDEIRQEMLKASETEAKLAAAPEKPMIPVVNIKPVGQQAKEGEVLPSPVPQNNATQLAKNTPLEVKKVEEPVMFSTKFDDEKSLKQGTAYKVSQGENNFGTIIEHDNNGEKEFVLAETGKKYSSLDDAKFALQEKLTGERVSEMDRVGIERIKVEGNLANKPIFIGDPANNNQLDMESKGAIQKAVRALRSVSNANVYLYGNAADYAKGIAHATGQTANDVANQAGKSNAQVVDANGENSIHINLEKADVTSLSHEVFHGALLGLAKKDPNAFITMRDKILDRISEKQSLMVTNPDGTKAKVSAKEYLLDFQKRYSGSEYTEADRAEEFLSELAGLMSLEDNNVVKDKTLLESIKLTIKDVLKKFNVEFDSLNELQETEDLVQFFKDFNRSVKTGESINLSRVQGIQGTAPTATQSSNDITKLEQEKQDKIKSLDERDQRSLDAVMPKNPNHPIFQVGMQFNQGMKLIIVQTKADENYDNREDAYEAITKIIEPAEVDSNGKMTKAAKVEVTLFNTKEEADAAIKANYEKIQSKVGQKQKQVAAEFDTKIKEAQGGVATQPTAQAAPTTTQPVKTSPKGTVTKFSILGEDNRFRPENANPKDNNVYYGVDEEGDVFMLAPESKLFTMLYDYESYIGRLYNITVPKGMRMAEGKGVLITELPKVDSQGNLVKKGKLTYTDRTTIKYDIKPETPVEDTATQPTAQAQPTATSQLIAPSTVTPAQPVEQFKEGDTYTKSASSKAISKDNKEIAAKDIFEGHEHFYEGKKQFRYRNTYAKTVMDKDGNVYTGFYETINDLPTVSHKGVYFSDKDMIKKSGTLEHYNKRDFIEAFEEGYGISVKDALAQQNIKLKPNQRVSNIMVDGERFEVQNGKPVRVLEGIFYIGNKGETVNGETKRIRINVGVPQLMFTDEEGIDLVNTKQPSSYGFTKLDNGLKESDYVPIVKAQEMIDGKLVDNTFFAKSVELVKGSQIMTRIYEKPQLKRERKGGRIISYYTPKSLKEFSTNYNFGDEILINKDTFEQDYGISFEQALINSGKKIIKPNHEVIKFILGHELFEMRDYKGNVVNKKRVTIANVVTIDTKTGKIHRPLDSWFDLNVPKLKYTDEITGISTAQPEAGAVKESVTTRPEGAKKKESIAKVISRAADKAQESVKKTKGNRKKIAERVEKVTSATYQASQIEPTNAREMAMQYFIKGGTVLRGTVTNGAKPKRGTLISLFAKPRVGAYFADEKEMSKRLQLVRNGKLTIEEIAHKLWESQDNQVKQISETDLRNAIEEVLMDFISATAMAKDLLATRGNPAQQAMISGDNTFAGMDEYELMTHQEVARIFGVSVEEVIANPEKFVNKDELEGMQEDMLTAFQILDELQDDEAVKEYLGISAPEDLFLDELVAEAAKPEKTLQEKKADLEKQIKAKKKELTAANKTKKEMGGIGQTSLVEGVQTTIVAPDTMKLYEKIRNLKGEIEDLNSQLGKVESAIEFKERKTIDAFADVVEQKADEALPAGKPSENLNEQEQDGLLKNPDGTATTFFMVTKRYDGVYELQDTDFFDRERNNDLGFSVANVTLKNFKRIEYDKVLFNIIDDSKLAELITQAKKSGSDGIVVITPEGKVKEVYVFDKANIHKANMGVSAIEKQYTNLSGSESISDLQVMLYESNLELESATDEKSKKILNRNIGIYEKAINAAKENDYVSIDGGKFNKEQIRIADSNINSSDLEDRLEDIQEEYNDITEKIEEHENALIFDKDRKGKSYAKQKEELLQLVKKRAELELEAENTVKALTLRVNRESGKATTKAQPAKAVSGEPSATKNNVDNVPILKSADTNYETLYVPRKVFELTYKNDTANNSLRDNGEPMQTLDSIIRRGGYSISELNSLLPKWKSVVAEARTEAAKATTKSQLSGARVTPFEKADPTYKYQLSGTEASLKLIDEVRKKYNMQHTAEEMGIIKKGMRATEGIISNNIVTRVLSKGSVAVNKMFSNDKANKLLGKPFAGLQNYIANNVRKGLGSQNAAAANASAIAVSLIQNLGSTEGFQSARNKLSGGKSVAKNQLWQLGKELNEMINNDKVALRRVHSLLDPEAFEDITDPTLPDSKADLSFAELRLFNVLRDMNDFIHEWHYRNGFLGTGEQADALYEKNKGSYFARMYNEIETERFGELYDALAKLPNAADFSMFKERKNFLDVTENLTLKEDPIYITTKRFGQMMQNQAILEFCDYVAKSKDYKIYKNKEDIPASAVSNYRLLAPKKGGGKVYGPLTGKYVPDIVAQQLQGIEFSNQAINLTYQAAKIFDKTFARQVLSKAKTVWNPLTRAGNITMNFVFASLAGVDPITLLKNRPAAKESLESYDSYARDLDANGLLGVSMGKELNEEKDKNAKIVLRDAANRLLKREGKATSEVELPASEKSKFRKIASDLDDMLTESYGKSDDVAKVALYKSLVDDYGKTREEAIKIVAGSMQNYNTVGKAYDYASKTVNRFVKFKADSARILYNSFKDRPLNLMATLGMYLAAQALASKISGEDEEERKIREERPYTNKIKIGPVTISLTMKFGDTEVNVARYLAPYSVYDAGYDSNWLKDASTYLPLQYDEHTFIAVNDPLIGPIVNLAADKDFRGMPISDPGKTPFIEKTVTDGEAFWNRVAFAGRNFGAPYYGWGENLIAAATGDKDYYGRSRNMSEAILNTVIKVQTVNNETLQKSYEGALRKLDRDIDNIGKTISHKANEKAENISEEASKEGMTDARLEKYIANQERIFMKFYEEQQKEGDKKIMELQRVQGVLGKLQEIKDRKK